MGNFIVFFRDKAGVGRIRIGGRVHGSDFNGFKDAREWLETMKAAGLYKDRYLVEE